MGALDDQIQVILYACYAVYLLMGIGLITMGAVYMGDTGAVGSTGGSLLFIGLFMLVVGGLAIFANYGENWTILAVIEVISLGLFLFLTATIVVSVLFALGYTDPVRSIIDDNWSSIAHNEGQGYNADPRSICFRYLSSCEDYADAYIAKPDGDTLGCSREDPVEFTAGDRDTYFADSFVSNFSEYKETNGRPTTSRADSVGGGTLKDASVKEMGGYNGQMHCHFPSKIPVADCGFFKAEADSDGNAVAEDSTAHTSASCAQRLPDNTEQMCALNTAANPQSCDPVLKWTDACASEKEKCQTCQSDCKDYLTNEARAGTEAVALFVFATVAFCLAAVIYNNFLTRDDNDEYEGVMQILAFAINGSVLLIGFVMIVMCIIRLVGSDGYTAVLLMLLFLGLFLLIAGGLAVLGIKQGNPTFINIACIFLALFGYVMLILGVVLAVCTGYIMNEAQVQYDQNYSKLREAVEKMDPAFCQLSTTDCERLTVFTAGDVKISPTSTSTHDGSLLWERQYQEMQKQADWMSTQAFAAVSDDADKTAANKLMTDACVSNIVCVACNGLFEGSTDTRGYHASATGAEAGSVNENGHFNGGGLWDRGADYPNVIEADRNSFIRYKQVFMTDYSGPVGLMATHAKLQDPDRHATIAGLTADSATERAKKTPGKMARDGRGASGFYFVGVDLKRVYDTIKQRYSLQDFKVCAASDCADTNWDSNARYYARDKDAAFTGTSDKRARSGGVFGNSIDQGLAETYNGNQYESCRLHPNSHMFAPDRRGSITGCSGPWRREGYEPSIAWNQEAGGAFKNADDCTENSAEDACTVATAPACALGWQFRSDIATEFVWTKPACDNSHVGALGRITAGPGAKLVQWNPQGADDGSDAHADDFSWCPLGCGTGNLVARTAEPDGAVASADGSARRTALRTMKGDVVGAKASMNDQNNIDSSSQILDDWDAPVGTCSDSTKTTESDCDSTTPAGTWTYSKGQQLSGCEGSIPTNQKITWSAIDLRSEGARTGTRCAAKSGNDGSCRVGASAFTCVSYKNSQNVGNHCEDVGSGSASYVEGAATASVYDESSVYGFNAKDRINTCPKGCKITYTQITARWGGDCTKDGDSCKAGCLFVAGTGKGNFAQRTDADTKAFLGEYITNVTAAWKNRTLFDSHIASTNGQAGLEPKVTQATGRCEGALQHWATSADCKKAVKDFGDTKDDASFSADVAGCKHCSSVILNSLTASEAALNTDIKNGYDWSRCLRAMYRKASGGGGGTTLATVVDQETIWGKNEKCNPSIGREACESMVRCSATGCNGEACASCDASFADDGTTVATGCAHTALRCQRFRTLRLKMPHTFCQFTDAACKTKLKEKMEDDMAVVAWVGIIFCVLFLGILYFTYRGVVVYMSGDDDDE